MAKRLKSNFKNMFLVLLVTTVLSALVLSMTYNATEGDIKKVKIAKQEAAVKKVMSGFDELDTRVEKDDLGNEIKIYDCLKDGESIGVAVQSYTMLGFSGRIDVMVGFRPDGTITETVVLKHLETPGLGDKLDIAKSKFPEQFWKKKIDSLQTNGKILVTKDGGKIDAITAATISSRAFCDAVDRAWAVYQTTKNNGGDE